MQWSIAINNNHGHFDNKGVWDLLEEQLFRIMSMISQPTFNHEMWLMKCTATITVNLVKYGNSSFRILHVDFIWITVVMTSGIFDRQNLTTEICLKIYCVHF